jgi:DNA-binding transcriptional regulator/RsmH inhibitor MraZ
MMETRLEVPTEFRELVAKTIDHTEQAFRLFFEAARASIPPDSATAYSLFQRTVQAKLSYARRLAFAKNLRETAAAHAAFLGTQVEIATDLIRLSAEC